jgi:hypothetical protein
MTGLSRSATAEFIVTANATTILRLSQKCRFVLPAESPGDAVRFFVGHEVDLRWSLAGPWEFQQPPFLINVSQRKSAAWRPTNPGPTGTCQRYS